MNNFNLPETDAEIVKAVRFIRDNQTEHYERIKRALLQSGLDLMPSKVDFFTSIYLFVKYCVESDS
jgi:hypothetical protein